MVENFLLDKEDDVLKDFGKVSLGKPYSPSKSWYSLNKYRLPATDYIEIIKKQNYCCPICGVDIEPLDRTTVVDHCHLGGEVRGILCQKCNILLAMADDDVEILNKAITYLKEREVHLL